MSVKDEEPLESSEPLRIYLHADQHPISRITSVWTEPVLEKARHEVLDSRDLGVPPSWLSTDHCSTRFMYFWRLSKRKGKGWFWTIYRFARRDLLCGMAASMFCDVCLWSQTSIMDRLLGGMEGKTDSWILYTYTILLFVVSVARLISLTYSNGKVFDVAYLTRGSIMGSIFRHSLHYANGPRQKYCGGRGINVIINDTSRIASTIMISNFIWLTPTRIVTAFAYSYFYIGVYSLPAIVFILLVTSTLYAMARLLKSRRRQLAVATDSRMGLTQEGLQGIKVVKYLALEDEMASKVIDARATELGLLFSVNGVTALCGAIDFWAPLFAATFSIAIMAAYGADLEPGKIFAFIQTCSSLIVPLWVLPSLVGSLVACKVSTKRIDHMLEAETVCHSRKCEDDEEASIIIKDGSFKWDAPPPDPTKKKKRKKKNRIASVHPISPPRLFSLNNVTLSIPRGSLVAIIGKSGAGKTSLLSAMLGDMKLNEGDCRLRGSLGVCEQNGWLIRGTVKENILFGLPFDVARYSAVIKQCALEADMNSFTLGDSTMIGEKGATLSGGQRQRISLARVAYARPEIALLDDPFSAVDANVAQCLFFDCIKNGTLRQATRVITTHHTGFLSSCDLIIAMDEGRIIAVGTFQELLHSTDPYHSTLREVLIKSPIQTADDNQEPPPPVALHTEEFQSSTALDEDTYKEDVNRHAGRAAVRAYSTALGGWWPLLLLGVLAIAADIFKVSREYFLRVIIKGPVADHLKLLSELATVGKVKAIWLYGILGGLQGLFSGMSSIFAVWICQKASERLHAQCLDRVLAARLSVYDVTPVGRILNRFSHDLDMIDSNFPDRITQLLTCLSALISTILLLGVYYPIILPTIILPLIGTFFLLQKFRRSWRQLQQLVGITQGPIVSHFSESLSGLTTIRAFKRFDLFVKKFDDFVNLHIYSCIWRMGIRRWVSLRAGITWTAYCSLVAAICIYLGASSDITGLVIMYVSMTIDSVDWSLRQIAEMESNFISVERLHQYIMALETEVESAIVCKPDNWPSTGRVEFLNVMVQYKPSLPAVISGFSFTFEPGRRVAIVGRSGAGKSTIIGALFRFVELREGAILIDGVDIASTPMKELRRSLAMVPQDPILFTGTLRSNLDPGNRHPDGKIWSLLESVKMRKEIMELPQKLETMIDETGGGFSVGQRQLLCLARALLRDAKIIVMDEATSNLDRETEALMQQSLAEAMKTMTVITIAHRLETILGHDVVIVMGNGRILEFGRPAELAVTGGAFASMLKAASVNLDFLS